jgi:hypothetical protein
MRRLCVLLAITAILSPPLVACARDPSHPVVEICGNGLDDDDNDKIDCLDPACYYTQVCLQGGCGDGVCTLGSETAANCLIDCHCGNHVCESYPPYNETPTNYPTDCSPTH